MSRDPCVKSSERSTGDARVAAFCKIDALGGTRGLPWGIRGSQFSILRYPTDEVGLYAFIT